ncbi:MAG: lipoate--protein ligase [Ignavibacteria bacterium]|nr:lipoate--protein ligase [Ignavibacteria bacterium]
MKLIDNKDIHDPTINLALEEYCVRNLDFENEEYLLFYINDPSIIIGKHQNTIEEINKKYVDEKNIIVVRRISGGGAVYHDRGNLNFSFLTKHSDDSVNNFKKFTQPIVDTLRKLGVNAELSGRNDITVDGRKVSGNAQFTNTKTMFSHGTILFNSNLDDVVEALNVKIDKIESKGIKSVRSRVANISEFLKEPMTIYDLKQKIIENIFKDYDDIPVLKLTDKQWQQVYDLSENKYKTWEWNYGRSPEFNMQRVFRFPFGQIDARIFVRDGIIKEIKFYGDYLAYGDSEDLEDILKETRFDYEHIYSKLKNLNLSNYFGEITSEEFSDWLVRGK